jgi:hypothetical protein
MGTRLRIYVHKHAPSNVSQATVLPHVLSGRPPSVTSACSEYVMVKEEDVHFCMRSMHLQQSWKHAMLLVRFQ